MVVPSNYMEQIVGVCALGGQSPRGPVCLPGHSPGTYPPGEPFPGPGGGGWGLKRIRWPGSFCCRVLLITGLYIRC